VASIAKYKAALRTAIRRNAHAQEVNFLNITAMMDMMTIILVFLLKSMSSSSANMPPSNELVLPASLAKCVQTSANGDRSLGECEPSDDGIEVVVSRDKILVDNTAIDGLEVPSCFNNPGDAPPSNQVFKLIFCKGDSRNGFASKFKARGIQSDPEITSLRERVRTRVPVAEEISRHKPKNNGIPKVEARIFFDRYTSYQVMTEVMFSLGLEKVAKYHFIMLKSQ
jgi:biopolymer transport protein ExbD